MPRFIEHADPDVRKPLCVEKCNVNDALEMKGRNRVILIIFMFLIMFMWYFASYNLQTVIGRYITDILIANALISFSFAVLFLVYFFFLLELFRPVKFNMKLNIIAVAAFFVYMMITIFMTMS